MQLLIGTGLALLIVFGVGALVISSQRSRVIRRLLVAGLILRVTGSLVYFGILETAYNTADYNRYIREGAMAVEATGGPQGADYSIPESYGGRWWGTPSISVLTSWVMRVVGTEAVPLMVVFGGISFFAASCFCVAFQHAFPEIAPRTYTAWLMLYPSLWFWPSPVGKDGPVLLGLGLAFLGVVGAKGRRNYLWIALGMAITLTVRPQYAFVFVAAVLLGLLLGRPSAARGWGKPVAVAVLAAGAAYVVSLSANFLGFDVTAVQETAEWIDRRGEATAIGGSAFAAASNPLVGIANVLFRPFPWEARGGLVLLSSAEVGVLWILLYRRRHAVAMFVRRYRKTEAFWISLLFTLALAAAVGMAVGNFGTLVRQRVHLYPFLFLIAASVPIRRAPRRRRHTYPAVGDPPPIPA